MASPLFMNMFLKLWSEKSQLWVPSVQDTDVGQAVFYPKMFTQKRKTSCDAAHCKNDVDPSVSALFFPGGPIAIGFAISQFVVAALYAQSGWRFSHIRQKCREVFPFRRYFNAATAMIMVLWFIGIGAALSHIFPSQISARGFAADRGSMTSWLSKSRSPQTASTAGQSSTGQQVAFVFGGNGSTFALADEVTVPSGRFQDFKFAQCGSDDGFFSLWHNSAFPLLCFRGGSRYCSRDSLLSKYETGGAIYQG